MAQENISQENVQPSASAEKVNTGMAIVAYILFFVPLLTDAKNDPFVKFHVKQGLVVFICWIAVYALGWILPWSLGFITTLLNLGVLVLVILGIMSAAKGEQKHLPVVGQFAEQFKI